MKYLILLFVFALAGCATDLPRDPIIVTQTVEVPVPVKCGISYPKAPSQKVTGLPKDASGYAKTVAVLEDLEEYRWYSKELHAALSKCAKDQEKN